MFNQPNRGGGVSKSLLETTTASANDILAGKVIIDKNGEPLVGTMPNRGAWNSSVSVNGSVTIPAGYHNGSGRVTNSVSTMGGQTITPRSTSQTVSCSGRYMTGNIVVNGDSNLVAANIISGKSIFGVAGNAHKLASMTFAAAPSTTSKIYDYYPNLTKSFYPLNLSLGFHAVTYGYSCYELPAYNGIVDKYGTFRLWAGSDSATYDVLINSKLVNGTNIAIPCARTGRTMDGGVAGYY